MLQPRNAKGAYWVFVQISSLSANDPLQPLDSRSKFWCVKPATKPIYEKAAIASISTSLLLAISPFLFAKIAVFLLGFLNWLLFMSVTFSVILRPSRSEAFTEHSLRRYVYAFYGALVAFTIASWFAVLMI